MSALNKPLKIKSSVNQEFESLRQEVFPRISMLEQRIRELEDEIQNQKKQRNELESKIASLSPHHVEELRGSVYRLGRVVSQLKGSL